MTNYTVQISRYGSWVDASYHDCMKSACAAVERELDRGFVCRILVIPSDGQAYQDIYEPSPYRGLVAHLHYAA